MPEFTTDWFSPNIPQWESLFTATGWDPDQPKTVLEIGSFEGRSTLWILERLLRHPDSRIHCIDTFEGGVEHDAGHTDGLYDRFRANLAAAPGGNKAIVHREPSNRGLVRLAAEGVGDGLIRVEPGDDAAGGAIVVAFNSYAADGPRCGRDWKSFTQSSDNTANSNFGCATTANLAAMIANPADLAAPRPEDPADAGRRQNVLTKYRAGSVTSTSSDSQATGHVSTAVN